MNFSIYLWLARILVLLVMIGFNNFCYRNTTHTTPNKITHNDTNSLKEVVGSINKFSLKLYSQYSIEDKNIFFSPFSISTAFSMTYEGARGQTAKEMQAVFTFPDNQEVRNSGFKFLFKEINKENKKYQLHTANALWAQVNFKFLKDYLNTIKQYYASDMYNLNFSQDAEGSRLKINKWVEEKTHDKIKDLIPRGEITSDTRLVLTNAIYFKGQWAKQFNIAETKEDNFRISAEKTVKVPMMKRTDSEATFNYFEDEDLQILELPYSEGEVSMLILLPKSDNIKPLEKMLNAEKIAEWKKSLRRQRVDVFIPKFKFETKYFMKETLIKMGMPSAFSSIADFSGMTGKKELFISQAIHQAFIEVNEEGTETAAATAVMMRKTAIMEPKTIPLFKADHPFIFLIQDNNTNCILFIGKVVNPIEN